MKISESINTNIEQEYTINDVTIRLSRLTLAHWIELEEQGVTLSNIETLINEKPVTWVSKLFWMLMSQDSKEKFQEDINIFRSNIEFENLEGMGNFIGKVIRSSTQKPKKKQTPTKVKQIGGK